MFPGKPTLEMRKFWLLGRNWKEGDVIKRNCKRRCWKLIGLEDRDGIVTENLLGDRNWKAADRGRGVSSERWGVLTSGREIDGGLQAGHWSWVRSWGWKYPLRPSLTDVIPGAALSVECLYSQKQNQDCYSNNSHRVFWVFLFACLFGLVAEK